MIPIVVMEAHLRGLLAYRGPFGSVISPLGSSYLGGVCAGVLPTVANIAKRVSGFHTGYEVYDHLEESDVHALLECLLAFHIWEGSGLDESLWASKFRSPRDCLQAAFQRLCHDQFGDFLAVLWKCWNARNRFIFNGVDGNPVSYTHLTLPTKRIV